MTSDPFHKSDEHDDHHDTTRRRGRRRRSQCLYYDLFYIPTFYYIYRHFVCVWVLIPFFERKREGGREGLKACRDDGLKTLLGFPATVLFSVCA